MISRKYETIVGLFVLASLVALLIMVLIIAQQEGLWQEYMEYRAVFKNVSGLKKGSEVRLAGVMVGTVTDITIGKDGRITVTFQVLGKYRNQIRHDSAAAIGYIGLLGDRSLDISSGSPDQPVVPPDGQVAAVEPLDIQEMLAKATPYVENLQKILGNLASLTESLMDPKGELNQAISSLKNVADKIDKGQGSLGALVNDPKLYQETSQAMAAAAKALGGLEGGKGLAGALLHDQGFRETAKRALKDAQAALANLQQAAARLPDMAKKAEDFLTNLDKAGQGLPDLVATGQGMAADVDKTAQAAQKSWLLRSYVPKARERTLRVEGEVK